MQDPQYQPNVTPVGAGLSAGPRITANRELIVSSVPSGSAPVGGGITWGSDAEAEIEESWVKARPLLAVA